MLATLRPLFPYLRRYRRDFVWGGLAVVISNAIWIFFPQVIRVAIDDLNQGVTRQKIFLYAVLLVAISALWMTLFYKAQPGTGNLLFGLRLIFGSAMVACLVLGVTAIRRRDIAAHRAWMIRAYAIGLAAGTQAFTGGIGGAIFGNGVLAADLAKGAGWVINLAVAEWAISQRAGRRPAPAVRPEHAGALS